MPPASATRSVLDELVADGSWMLRCRVARDYYQVLGIERSAADGDVKRAYRKLARELHPDVTGDDPRATERFKEVTVAYETLSDPQRRRTYDLFGTKDSPPPAGPAFPMDLDGLLNQVFPNRKKKPRPQPGIDLEKRLQVTFVESYTGCTKHLGDLKLVVPAGVTDGTRLRVRGKGGDGDHGGVAGDLYVVVDVEADKRFRRDGNDLYVDADVSLRAALLGGHVDITLPAGGARMTIPPRTSGGRVFRLRGKGFPNAKGTSRGDVMVTAIVTMPAVPDALRDEVSALLGKLGDDDTASR
jgi:DnaJ-class molecular chaperone